MISLAKIQQLSGYEKAVGLFEVVYQGNRCCVPEGLKTRRELVQQSLIPKGNPVGLWVGEESVEVLFKTSDCQPAEELAVIARTRLYRIGLRPTGSIVHLRGKSRYFSATETEMLTLDTISREEYQCWRRGIREQLETKSLSISKQEVEALKLMLQILDMNPPLQSSIFELETPEGMTAVSHLNEVIERKKDHRHQLTHLTEGDYRAFQLLTRYVAVSQEELLKLITKSRLNDYHRLYLIAKFSASNGYYYKLGDKGRSFVQQYLPSINKDELIKNAIELFKAESEDVVVLNLQTTNSLPSSEVIHLAIVNAKGQMIYENYYKTGQSVFKPVLEHTALTHSMLDTASSWKEEWSKIESCIKGKQVLTDNGVFILDRILSMGKQYGLRVAGDLKMMDLESYLKDLKNVSILDQVYQASSHEFYNARCRTFLLARIIHPEWKLKKTQLDIEKMFQQYCESTVVNTLEERQIAGWKWIQQLFQFMQSPETFSALSLDECQSLKNRLTKAMRLVESRQ